MFLASRAKRLRALPWALAILNAACSALTLGIDLTHVVYADSLSAFLRDVPFQVTAFAGLLAAMVCAWLFWRGGGALLPSVRAAERRLCGRGLALWRCVPWG